MDNDRPNPCRQSVDSAVTGTELYVEVAGVAGDRPHVLLRVRRPNMPAWDETTVHSGQF